LAEAASAPVPLVQSALLAPAPHGFLGRRGGVSGGIHGGLNVGLGSDDDPKAIAENRRRAVEAVLPDAELVTLHQVHSAAVVTVTGPIAIDARPLADAMVTDRPGLLLGVLSADCVPILFADHAARVIGAAHSGWKGAIGGVSEATIAAMEQLGADRRRIAAAIGPAIAQPSYEVDQGFFERFIADDPSNSAHFVAGSTGHWQFDLPGYVAQRLRTAGIGAIDSLGIDTYANDAAYFSFRRATHRTEPGYGRQISLIALRA
jgi:hypothetical protein